MPSPLTPSARRSAFTLIQLVVVITVIVVLLAMLTPALDKAIFAAELAACGAQQRGVASSVSTYAMNHRRRYPDRTVPWTAEALKTPVNWPPLNDQHDDRPLMRTFMDPNLLVCPPAGSVDVDDRNDPHPEGSFVLASMAMWWDWQYDASKGGGAGMNRMGDRWEWNGRAFSWLVTDVVDVDMTGSADNKAAHPDDQGAFTQFNWQFEDTVFAIGAYHLKATWALWFGLGGTFQRGAIEANCAASDGSVTRYTFPALDAGYTRGGLEGFADVPVFRNVDRYNDEGEHNLVPRN